MDRQQVRDLVYGMIGGAAMFGTPVYMFQAGISPYACIVAFFLIAAGVHRSADVAYEKGVRDQRKGIAPDDI